MDILIIGDTRNVGHFLTLELLQRGHQVAVFNRGKTPDQLPPDVQRLRGDRSNPIELAKELAEKSFDVVIDMALYNGPDAHAITELLQGHVGQYIFLSTGQIYLVRKESPRPFAEDTYEQPVMQAPPLNIRDYDEWLYGVEKSQAEEILLRAWQTRGFPVTTLRLPMVNSERDHFHRVYNYLLRLQDGGPILIPYGDHLRLRHVYVTDVLQAIQRVIQSGWEKGRVYNISQDETISMEDFLRLLAEIAGRKLQLAYIAKSMLEHLHLFPDCSPFSDPWMSELDNQRSKLDLGMQYTALPIYLQKLVEYYKKHSLPLPDGYRRREEEIRLVHEV